jgi:hypothetical protein
VSDTNSSLVKASSTDSSQQSPSTNSNTKPDRDFGAEARKALKLAITGSKPKKWTPGGEMKRDHDNDQAAQLSDTDVDHNTERAAVSAHPANEPGADLHAERELWAPRLKQVAEICSRRMNRRLPLVSRCAADFIARW